MHKRKCKRTENLLQRHKCSLPTTNYPQSLMPPLLLVTSTTKPLLTLSLLPQQLFLASHPITLGIKSSYYRPSD